MMGFAVRIREIGPDTFLALSEINLKRAPYDPFCLKTPIFC